MSSLADVPELVGFFSYSRDDDESYRGRLSALREAIQHELSAQLGRSRKNFRLWQDHEAIAPGRLWEAEIKTAVEQAAFFIPIVTPRAVNSQYCQYEFEAFLARERELGRSDLVFPILYVPVPALENEAQWRDHPVLSVIGRRQYVDWQTFRYADAPTPAMREEIARFARKIVEALSQPWLSPQERRQQEEAAAQERAENHRRTQEAQARQRTEEEARRRSEEAQAQRLAEERRLLAAEAERRTGEEAARKRTQAQAQERAEQERRGREADAKRRSEEERALTAAKAAGEAGTDASFATHLGPKRPPWQPSRRAMLIGGGALGAGALGVAAIIASREPGREPTPAPTPEVVNPPPAPAAPAVVKASAGPVKIGFCNPLTGFAATLGTNQLTGCQVAIDQINARGGVLGRRLDLVSYDAPDLANAARIASKLIVADQVDVLVGHLMSAAALAISQITNQNGILQIVPGARSDDITGAQCKWNVFRLGNTSSMQANAICPQLFKAYGRSWYFITSDLGFTRTAYQHYDASLKKLGGRIAANSIVPLNLSDFSAELIKAKAAKPDVLVPLLLGNDLVNCLKQGRELGIDRQLHLGGSQLDLETVQTMPPEARFGTWVFDWYWKQPPGTPGLDPFVAAVRKRSKKVPTAHTWFAYAAIQAYALACEAAKTSDSKRVALALTNMALPLDLRMQPNSAFIRGADHQLLSSAFIGELLQKGDGDPENLVKVTNVVAGDTIAPAVADTGCVMRLPA